MLTGQGRQSDRHDQLLHPAINGDASPDSQTAQGCLLVLQCQPKDTTDRPNAGCTHTCKTGDGNYYFNPLNPNIKIQFLFSCPHTFIIAVVRRSHENFKKIHLG